MTRVAHIQPIATGGRPPEGRAVVTEAAWRVVGWKALSTCNKQIHSALKAPPIAELVPIGDRGEGLGRGIFGETFVEQRSITSYYTPYTFSAKERDTETGYSYFGARYYDADISIWLSVDPMADKYPYQTGYCYVGWRPIMVIDPNGMWEQDADGNWVAQKGYGAWTLHKDAGISFQDALGLVHGMNKARGEKRENMVFIGDMITIPGNEKSDTKTDNVSESLLSNYTPLEERQCSHCDLASSSSGTSKTVNTIATVGNIATDAAQQIVRIPNVGYNFAYNNNLLLGINGLKPASYGLSVVTVFTDINMSSNGQQSWGETGLNTSVTITSIAVGGWPGLIIQANYQASKAYMKALARNPDWAPYPVRGFNH